MNQLSWLLYLADVSDSSEGWLIFFGGLATVVSLTSLLVLCNTPLDEKGVRAAAGNTMLVSVPATLVCVLLSVLLPSRDTVYAIAASELGEQVLTSETGQRAGRALNAWLDKQISNEAPATPATTN
jgi:ABC-type Co2+ transport system permease subunit